MAIFTAFAADAAPPWEDLRVTLPNGLDVHYLAAGHPDAPTVVLLHGFPDYSYGWRVVLPSLAVDHRVVAPDLRGYAGTSRADRYTIGDLVGDLEGFLDATQAAERRTAPVHLIGHDWAAS